MSDPTNPPLAHSFMPLPASVIPWCELSSRLAQIPVQAWGFVYMDAATNQPIGLQAVLAKDMPALFDAASDAALQNGWRALQWVDIMPDAVDPDEYEHAVLTAMQRRWYFLLDQMSFLGEQIAAQQIKANPQKGESEAMQDWCQVEARLRQQLHVVETRIAQGMGTLLSQPPSPF